MAQDTQMKAILFRHGHKSLAPLTDPDLTEKGFEQSRALLNKISNDLLPVPTHCWVSEKVRTKQTLDAAIQNYKPQTNQKTELDVRLHHETLPQFRARIQKFISDITNRKNENETHFICTHYDWIEESLTMIDSDQNLNSHQFASWAPGQYLIFDIRDGIWNYVSQGVL